MLIPKINEKYPGRIQVSLVDMTGRGTDMSGWVIFVGQEEYLTDTERLMQRDEGYDPYVVNVAVIEVSELEVNEGKPVMKFKEWFDQYGNCQIDGFGVNVGASPEDVVIYLNYILESGNTRLTLLDR